MEAAVLRFFIPANGGIIVDRHWVDDNGNPTSYRITTWVGQPRPGEGQGDRAENQV
jgi:hypothetical protein